MAGISQDGRGLKRIGTETLLCVSFLGLGLTGLFLLETEVPVFSFGGGSGPDARFFPRIVLGLLVAARLVRLSLARKSLDIPLGSTARWLRVALSAGGVIAGTAMMPLIGFFGGAVLAGAATVLAFGESRPWVSLIVTLVVAGLVTLAARELIHIPLP